MDRMLSLVVVAVLALAAFVAARGTLRRVVIREHQTGLLFRRGRLARTLDAGAYWIARPALRLVVVDTRPRIVSTAGQEVPVKDGTPIRATLAIRYRVADPATARPGETLRVRVRGYNDQGRGVDVEGATVRLG